jgi:FMN reductase [NAD(P)H]
MNEVIKTILNHRSIRNYRSEAVSKEALLYILQAAQMAPSSINGQQMSIIVVEDEARKARLSECSGNQIYINQAPVFLVFCADFYRAKIAAELNGTDFKIPNSLEATLIGSIDVGLAMANAITAAESLGLGTVPIGGIRNQPSEVIKELNFPEYVFPLCGLVIGHPLDNSEIKPRLSQDTVVFNEQYNPDLKAKIEDYDHLMSNYMLKRTNGESNRNWSSMIAKSYEHGTKRDIRKAMKEQNFDNN